MGTSRLFFGVTEDWAYGDGNGGVGNPEYYFAGAKESTVSGYTYGHGAFYVLI